VLVLPVVARMACRAVRLVRRVWPGHDLGVCRMAVSTAQADPVIAGIGGAAVAEGQRRPVAGVMADVALLGRYKVSGRFAGRRAAVVAV